MLPPSPHDPARGCHLLLGGPSCVWPAPLGLARSALRDWREGSPTESPSLTSALLKSNLIFLSCKEKEQYILIYSW